MLGLQGRAGIRGLGLVFHDDVLPAYTPPISVDALICYGFRILKVGYSGPLVRLRRSSDSVELDFSADETGVVDLAAIATWLGGSTGYVVTLYDQSGNGNDATESIAANQPEFIASQNGRPALKADGAASKMNLTDAITASRTAYVTMQNLDATNGSMWINRSGSTTDYFYVLTNGGNYQTRVNDAPGDNTVYDSGVSVTSQAVTCGSWQSGGNKHSGLNGFWGSALASSADCIWNQLFRYTSSVFYADGYCWEIVILPDDERDSAIEDAYLADVASYCGFSLDA